MDDRQCARPRDTAAAFECLGMAPVALVEDLFAGKTSPWQALRKHQRVAYLAIDLSLLVLLAVLLGVVFDRRRSK